MECVPVRVEAREDAKTFHLIPGAGHEEHRRLSVRAHDLSLARNTDHSSGSDIANDARTSHLPSSSDAYKAPLQHDDYIRPKHECYRLPPLHIVLRSQPRLERSHIRTTKGGPMITVDRLMTRQMVNIEAGTSAIEAAKIMKTHKIGSLFVKQKDRIIGIVTEPDIIRKVVGAERVPYYIPVEEIMSSPVIGIDGRRSVTEAADLMEQHGTRHLAVFKGNSIVGILSVLDLQHPVSIDEF